MLEGRARECLQGISLELFVVIRILGQLGSNARGGDSGALVVETPVALILVGGDVNDTMPRPVVGAERGSRSLPILPSLAALGKGHGEGSPSTKANMTLPGCHPFAAQEGFLLSYTSSERAVVFDVRAVGDDHALCGINQRAWCPAQLSC